MWELVTITGELEGNSLRIKLPSGEEMLAPIVTALGLPLPSQTWITNNKDSLLAVAFFQDSLNPEPIITGFYPVKGANSEKFSIFERLLQVNKDLLELLTKGKVMTQLGPQTFMPDTQAKLQELQKEVTELEKNIYTIKL